MARIHGGMFWKCSSVENNNEFKESRKRSCTETLENVETKRSKQESTGNNDNVQARHLFNFILGIIDFYLIYLKYINKGYILNKIYSMLWGLFKPTRYHNEQL